VRKKTRKKAKNSILHPLRVLVAEDNAVHQSIILGHLQKLGAEVRLVENGEKAAEQGRIEVFDLVFMDIHMPQMDGLEACRLILKENPKLPIIAVTANVLSSDISEYFKAGMKDYLAKPFNRDGLLEIIFKWTQNPNKIQGLRAS